VGTVLEIYGGFLSVLPDHITLFWCSKLVSHSKRGMGKLSHEYVAPLNMLWLNFPNFLWYGFRVRLACLFFPPEFSFSARETKKTRNPAICASEQRRAVTCGFGLLSVPKRRRLLAEAHFVRDPNRYPPSWA